MSKFETVSYQEQTYNDDKDTKPPGSILHWISKARTSTVRYYSSSHEIAASATDEAITLDEDDDTLLTFIWINDTDDTNITVKTNSDSTAMQLRPLRILSGKLTALTVTNADASNVKDLLIGRIVVSDTTNTTLKEERE